MTLLAALACAVPMGTAAARPVLYVVNVELPGMSQAECLQRARPALAAVGFRLGQASRTEQQAALGDYSGTAVCVVSGQQVTAFVTVSGPDTNPVVRLARSVRNRIERPDRLHAPIPANLLVQASASTTVSRTP